MTELIKRDDAIKTMMRFRGYDGFDEDMMYRIKYALTHHTPVAAEIPETHGPLVDLRDVQKELDRLFAVIVKDESTGLYHKEYPIILEDNPIRIPIIIPATERKE
ncbi:MAG: hypothetical protein IIZ78_20670 [Clostridiales bacterium]|nr:hypothetical protein [Clostridiales bacterium]